MLILSELVFGFTKYKNTNYIHSDKTYMNF